MKAERQLKLNGLNRLNKLIRKNTDEARSWEDRHGFHEFSQLKVCEAVVEIWLKDSYQ
jgi:hypothetical protein